MPLKITRLFIALASVGTVLLLALARPAHAQVARPIQIVVPYAPGGGTDILARHLAEQLPPELGAPVIVVNRAGANGNIGAEVVVRAPADGDTLLLGDLALAVNPSLFKKMPFDPIRDLRPIAIVATAPLVLIVHPSVKAATVNDLIALAKSEPGTLSFASAGIGNPPQMAGELFKLTAGVDIMHVPYKGVGPALTDLLGGQVSMLFTGISSAKQYIDGGQVKALAVTGPRRASSIPNVPTMIEAGYPEANVTSWWALFGPAALAPEAVSKISRAAEHALSKPDLQDRLAKLSIVASYGDADALAKMLRSETDRWARVVHDAMITID